MRVGLMINGNTFAQCSRFLFSYPYENNKGNFYDYNNIKLRHWFYRVMWQHITRFPTSFIRALQIGFTYGLVYAAIQVIALIPLLFHNGFYPLPFLP